MPSFHSIFQDEHSPFYFHLEKFSGWKKGRKSKIFIVIIALLFLLLYLSFHVFHVFYYNSTTSATRGFYMAVPYTTLQKGDYAIVSCPKDYPPLAKEGALLLKRVEGLPGDTFTVEADSLVLNNESYPIYHSVSYLPQLPQGTFKVPENMYLFLNAMPYSFDSRYIGPVTEDKIVKKVVLVFDADHAISVINSVRKELP